MRFAAVVFSLGIGLGFLTGCASSSDAWMKPGVTAQERDRDTLECGRDSSFTVPGGPMGGPRREFDQDRYRRCMTDKGYTAGPTK